MRLRSEPPLRTRVFLEIEGVTTFVWDCRPEGNVCEFRPAQYPTRLALEFGLNSTAKNNLAH